MVTQTKQRIRWPLRRILRHLEIAPATYHRWLTRAGDGASAPTARAASGSLFEILLCERQKIIDYALSHADLRHRELAWKMLDENVVALSPSTVYRVLGEENLVCRWVPRGKRKGVGRGDRPTRPNEQWQTDLRYVKVGLRNFYLLAFLDVYSRYIVHHELLRFMDGRSVAIAAATAIGKLPAGIRPTIQSDHGSCYIAREFAQTLDAMDVGHHLIRPHTPTDNAEIERCNRTIGEKIDEALEVLETADFAAAEAVIDGVIDHYNHHRLHSSLNYLRPVDYYRGDPEPLLAERRRKLKTARELRKQENLKLRQKRLPYQAEETILNSERQFVSL
ncbi:MAG: DDE-type integrase/transposase/recombinase [Planctomycetia bacterium]|nr:DDE-type integrase/transposase/recombinase [Planctomycetia bacterium]MBE7506915.1 DDE-type integrase/transposase/recombinase [Planctomycetia bacterium]